ncbi:MAG TPA: hypothetical protein VKP13_07880 [Nitrospira sp.]|nr:hypothetical protein [Nitrospira sp.]
MDHLRTRPFVALNGWVYSILTGEFWVYDFVTERVPGLPDEPAPRLKAAG